MAFPMSLHSLAQVDSPVFASAYAKFGSSVLSLDFLHMDLVLPLQSLT